MATLACIVNSYNSIKFLSRCLDSILSQKTHHFFKILIIDDCSTDGTQSLAKTYENEYDNIYFFSTKKNTGIGKKCVIELEEKIAPFLHTDYFYRIDYDDYIIDSEKFEKQINILELDKNLIASCHQYRIENENGHSYDDRNAVVGTYSSKDLLELYLLNTGCIYNHTSTFMFRNIFKSALPSRFRNAAWAYGDVLYFFDFLRFGDCHYSGEVMTTYFLHNKGVWTSLKKDKQIKINRILRLKLFYFLNLSNKLYFVYFLLKKVIHLLLKKVVK